MFNLVDNNKFKHENPMKFPSFKRLPDDFNSKSAFSVEFNKKPKMTRNLSEKTKFIELQYSERINLLNMLIFKGLKISKYLDFCVFDKLANFKFIKITDITVYWKLHIRLFLWNSW